jgi:hypothetical protein
MIMQIPPVKIDETNAVLIVDIDGTLTDNLFPIEKTMSAQAFTAKLKKLPLYDYVHQLKPLFTSFHIHFVTGRPASKERLTREWLERNLGITRDAYSITLVGYTSREQYTQAKIDQFGLTVAKNKAKYAVIIDDDAIIVNALRTSSYKGIYIVFKIPDDTSALLSFSKDNYAEI